MNTFGGSCRVGKGAREHGTSVHQDRMRAPCPPQPGAASKKVGTARIARRRRAWTRFCCAPLPTLRRTHEVIE